MSRAAAPLKLLLLIAALALLATACNDKTSSADLAGRRGTEHLEPEPAGLDFGEEWANIGMGDWNNDASAPAQRAAQPAANRPSSGAAENGTVWTIVLETLTGEGHEAAAAARATELRRLDPRLAQAWTHSTTKGSMVLLGRYDEPADAQARDDLQWVKSRRSGGVPAFRGAMISRLWLESPAARSPYALLSVRQLYPNVDPLYTLQVAAWGSFEGALPWPEAQRRAETNAVQLRSQNLPAYVHHDPDKELSVVTIGLFGADAIDPRTGIVSPDVEVLMRRFPHNLVNGEVFNEPLDPQRPSRGTRPQPSRLVLVPNL